MKNIKRKIVKKVKNVLRLLIEFVWHGSFCEKNTNAVSLNEYFKIIRSELITFQI